MSATHRDPRLTVVAPPAARTSRAKTFRERAYVVGMAMMGPLARIVERSSLVPTTLFLSVQDLPGTWVLEPPWREINQAVIGAVSLPPFLRDARRRQQA